MSILDEVALGTRRHHAKVKKICEPLKQLYGIEHLGYVEVRKNLETINIHTHTLWLENCLDKKYYIDDPHMISPDRMGEGFVLWSSYEDTNYLEGMLQDSIQNFNICHGLTYINKANNGYKVFGFGTVNENFKLHNKILNNLETFKKFITYLDSQLEPIRKDLSNNMFNLLDLKGNNIYEQNGVIQPIDNRIEQYRFFIQLGLIEEDIKDTHLSDRETQCVRLYLEGKSATQTAKILSLSPRTVESHMENIKNKLNIKFKRELFEKASLLKELELI